MNGCFYSIIKPNFLQIYLLNFFNQCLSQPHSTSLHVYCYSTALRSVGFLGMETWHGEIANNWNLYESSEWKDSVILQKNLVDSFYHCLILQIFVCRMLFNGNASGNFHCIANIRGPCFRNLEVVWILVKNTCLSQKPLSAIQWPM